MGADARVDILLALKSESKGVDEAIAALPKLNRELQRTEQEAKKQLASVTHEFEKMGRKFSLGNFAVDIFKGFGLGSGFGIAELAITKWVDLLQDGQKAAEAFAKSQAELNRQFAELARVRADVGRKDMSPAGQLASLNGDLARAKAEALALTADRAKLGDDLSQLQTGQGTTNLPKTYGYFTSTRGMADKIGVLDDAKLKEWAEKMKEILQIESRIKDLQAQITQTTTKDAAKQGDDWAKQALERRKELEAQILAGNKIFVAEQEALAKSAQKYRELIDPTLEFKNQISEVNKLLAKNKISDEEAAKAIALLTDSMTKAQATAVDGALKDFFEPLDRMTDQHFRTFESEAKETAKVAKDLGYAFQSSFEDAILSGAKLSDVLRGLARDIAQIALRTAITNPIGNAIGGFITTALGGMFGGGGAAVSAANAINIGGVASVTAAGGGSFVTRGRTNFTVGDNPGGVELVSVLPLSGIGRSTMNGRNVAMAGGGSALVGGALGGGDTFNFAYSFQGGVSRAEVMGILPSMVSASKSAVLEAKRRRRDGFR